ncbi:MAG: GntR family transcriptional regulator [Terrimesophilobacter sp.]
MTIEQAGGVLPDAIYDAVRADILDQTETPGSALTESAIAARFGVARPTAKLALERLVGEGLLRREHHKTARIPQLSREDISDVFENRAIIESVASSALARAGAVPPAAVAAHRRLVTSAAAGDFARDDIAFHRALVAGQPSPRLTRMHEVLMGEVELGIGQVQAHHLLAAADVAEQHQNILNAIVAGDPVLAERLTRDHINGAREALLAHYDANSEK